MKTYFVKTRNISSLQTALGRMIEYAKFLEEDSGRASDAFADHILKEENISVEVQEND